MTATVASPSQKAPRPQRPHRPLTVFRLAGSQAEMGRQHGQAVREAGGHDEVLQFYPSMPADLIAASLSTRLADRIGAKAVPFLIRRALTSLDKNRPPQLRARTQAFMQSVGAGEDMVRYLSVMDAFQNFVGSAAKLGLVKTAQHAAAVLPPMCSSLVAWGGATEDGRLLHARNFDFPGRGVWERVPAVVFCDPDDGLRYGFITAKGADVPGVTCFNEAGLVLDAHTRFHEDVSFTGKMVVDVGHDIIRRASTLDEAIAIARERPIASTWGFTVSSAAEGRAVVIETTAQDVRVTEPPPGEAFLATTNRYHHPTLAIGEVVPAAAFAHHCHARSLTLRQHAERALAAGGFSLETLQDVLGDTRCPETGIERPAGGVVAQPETVQSVVIDPSRQVVRVSVGDAPTGRGPWAEVPWQWGEMGSVTEVVADPRDTCALPSRYEHGDAARARDAFFRALENRGRAPVSTIAQDMEEAVALDGGQSDYRFLLGALRAQAGDYGEGLAQWDRALDDEPAGFMRGQLLLWSSRAADALGHRSRAADYRAGLFDETHALLGDHKRAARRERKKPCTQKKLRGMPVGFDLIDAG